MAHSWEEERTAAGGKREWSASCLSGSTVSGRTQDDTNDSEGTGSFISPSATSPSRGEIPQLQWSHRFFGVEFTIAAVVLPGHLPIMRRRRVVDSTNRQCMRDACARGSPVHTRPTAEHLMPRTEYGEDRRHHPVVAVTQHLNRGVCVLSSPPERSLQVVRIGGDMGYDGHGQEVLTPARGWPSVQFGFENDSGGREVCACDTFAAIGYCLPERRYLAALDARGVWTFISGPSGKTSFGKLPPIRGKFLPAFQRRPIRGN
ncbi:hypothetical protein B0H13DRAFT_1891653 [Mycena leptocephala]|nr:hypothetical protein B0H13DRAFT_1891653 [Mycena leptocephala]